MKTNFMNKYLILVILTSFIVFFISCNEEEPQIVDLCKTATCE